jgi:hypothetical protein
LTEPFQTKHVGCADDVGCAGEYYDQGLFSVSLKTVQFTDTFDSSTYIHMNGPTHFACVGTNIRYY